MLSQYISAFQGFFSRAFWFGSFLPGALFAFVHLVIASLAFSDVVPLAEWLKADPAKLTMFPILFAALVVLGYVLSPMVPLFRDLLDASRLPQWTHDDLRDARVPRLQAISGQVDAAENLLGLCRGMIKREFGRIQAARAAGNGTQHVDEAAIAPLAEEMTALKTRIDAGTLPTPAQLQASHDRLVTVLTANNSSRRDGTPAGAASARLDDARETFIDLVASCERQVADRRSALLARHCRVAFRNPQATRMADARVLTESYSVTSYNVDFAYLWPRLQSALPEQGAQGAVDSYNDRLISARARVDFAVLSTVLAITVPLVWLPLLAWLGASVLLFLAVGIVGPLCVWFFYEIAIECQFDFGETVKSAIDKYRFNVLTELRLPLPPTLRAERELWGELRVVEQIGSATDLFYRHPSSTGGQK
jgi:hypothetical protein